MALDLTDIDAVLDPDMIVRLPGGDGKLREYRVPPVSAAVGLWLRRMSITGEGESGSIPLPEDVPYQEAILGKELVEQLAADGVPDPVVELLVRTQVIRVIAGDDAARKFWQAGGDPNQLRPPQNRAQRRAATKPQSSSRTTSTDGAGTTRARGSGSGTSSRQNAKRSKTPA